MGNSKDIRRFEHKQRFNRGIEIIAADSPLIGRILVGISWMTSFMKDNTLKGFKVRPVYLGMKLLNIRNRKKLKKTTKSFNKATRNI